MGRVADWELLLGEFDRVALDTNAVIYFLDRTEPYAPLITALFRGCEEGGWGDTGASRYGAARRADA
jgi:hypothetical protein